MSTSIPKHTSWQCVMICWGTRYSVELINHLVETIEKKSSLKPTFVLITDAVKPNLHRHVKQVNFPDFYLQPILQRSGCQAKLVMFEEGILPPDLPAIYVDLDTVILGDMAKGLNFLNTPQTIAILPSAIVPFGHMGRWLYLISNKKRYARGNSSIVVFHPAHCGFIAQKFRELFTINPNFEFRPMVADERFISWCAQPYMRALPRSFVVKFPGEFMFYNRWWLHIKAKLPWVIRRREQLVAITLNGATVKPEELLRLPDGAVIIDQKSRILIWSKQTMGKSRQAIMDFYRFLNLK